MLEDRLVMTELIKYTFIESSPLPLLQVEYEQTGKWQSMIAQIQQAYLSEINLGTARLFRETLEKMESIILNQRHFTPTQRKHIQLLSFATLNLESIYLLFSDPEVTEIFSNKIGNDIIISHRKYGRCRTNQLFTNDMWESLKIRAEYDSGKPLNSRNPALKFGIQSELGNFRISLQVEPLSTLGPTISVRRLPQHAISLEKLVEEKQIAKEHAEYLIEALLTRKNVIVAGEPGSGKTTLANALLLKSDKTWRLILMEDTKEMSIDPHEFPLLIQYNMPSVGSDNRYRARADEISRLLHRSPDYVFLGEIQNQDDTKVAFEGFAAGIRGMATTHAKSLKGLLNRWTYSHNLPNDLISSLDLVVMTSREIVSGKVIMGIQGIYEQKKGEFIEVF